MNIRRALNDVITVADPASRSAHGDPTYGATRTVAARIEYEAGQTTGTETARQQSTVLYTEEELKLDARVWLPGANTSSASAALKVLVGSCRAEKDLRGRVVFYKTTL